MAANICKIFSRNVVVYRSLQDSLREPLALKNTPELEKNYAKTAEMWKKVFIFICVPLIALSGVNVLMSEETKPPEFKPYEHLRIRRKNYPWGDGVKSFFHNPHTNALPTGYESDHH